MIFKIHIHSKTFWVSKYWTAKVLTFKLIKLNSELYIKTCSRAACEPIDTDHWEVTHVIIMCKTKCKQGLGASIYYVYLLIQYYVKIWQVYMVFTRFFLWFSSAFPDFLGGLKRCRLCQKQVPIFISFCLFFMTPPPSPLGATSFMDVPLPKDHFLRFWWKNVENWGIWKIDFFWNNQSPICKIQKKLKNFLSFLFKWLTNSWVEWIGFNFYAYWDFQQNIRGV